LEVPLAYRDPAILATSTRGNHLPPAKNKVMRLLLPVSALERRSLPQSQIFSDLRGRSALVDKKLINSSKLFPATKASSAGLA